MASYLTMRRAPSTPDGPLRGADAIRSLFQAMIAEFGKPGAAFSMKQHSVEGDFAYILWTAETADNVYEMCTDTWSRGTVRLWRSHSPARLRQSAENLTCRSRDAVIRVY